AAIRRRWTSSGLVPADEDLMGPSAEGLDSGRSCIASSRWGIIAALTLAACASPPLYTESTPPTVMMTATAAGVLDMRGTYREALCRRLAGSSYSCDGVLRRLPG